MLSEGGITSHYGRTCTDVEAKVNQPAADDQPRVENRHAERPCGCYVKSASPHEPSQEPEVHKLTGALFSILWWMDGWMEIWFEGVMRTISNFFFHSCRLHCSCSCSWGELKSNICPTFESVLNLLMHLDQSKMSCICAQLSSTHRSSPLCCNTEMMLHQWEALSCCYLASLAVKHLIGLLRLWQTGGSSSQWKVIFFF